VIEFFLQPNIITGLPAMALALLIMVAFRSYALTWNDRAVAHLGAALFWLSTRSLGRSVWWDVFHGFDFGNPSNWIWNLIGIYACYHALHGFRMLIPARERDKFNIITVAFYPREFRVYLFRNKGENK